MLEITVLMGIYMSALFLGSDGTLIESSIVGFRRLTDGYYVSAKGSNKKASLSIGGRVMHSSL